MFFSLHIVFELLCWTDYTVQLKKKWCEVIKGYENKSAILAISGTFSNA